MTQIQHDNHRRVRGETGGDQSGRGNIRHGLPPGVTSRRGGTDAAGDEPARTDDLLLAACRLIDQQLAHPGLDAAFIAARLGCSRATLYRAFAARDLAVAGYIRERRLQRVWRLLHSLPPSVPIAEAARRCGFLDSTSFSRLFRRRFGMRARDVRAGR